VLSLAHVFNFLVHEFTRRGHGRFTFFQILLRFLNGVFIRHVVDPPREMPLPFLLRCRCLNQKGALLGRALHDPQEAVSQ